MVLAVIILHDHAGHPGGARSASTSSTQYRPPHRHVVTVGAPERRHSVSTPVLSYRAAEAVGVERREGA